MQQRIISGVLFLIWITSLNAQTTILDLGRIVVEDETQSDNLVIEQREVVQQRSLKTYKVVDVAEILADEIIEASMIRKSGYGNEVGLRGFTKSNLKFTQDGTLIEGSCGSRKDPPLSHINMLTIKNLEIKEGPYDVTVPGALGGSINVMTKNPQKDLHGELFSKFGSYGFLSQGGSLTGGSNKIQALAGYNYSASGQYKDGDGNKLNSFNSAYDNKNIDAFEKHDFWGKLSIKPNAKHRLLLSSSVGKANNIMTPRVGMDTADEETYLNKLTYQIHDLGKLSKQLIFSAYYNKIEHYPSGKYRSGAVNQKRIEAKSYTAGGKIENNMTSSLAIFTYGLDFYSRNWKGDVINRSTGVILNDSLFPDVDELNIGAYIKAERDIKKFSLMAGLRVDRFHSKANETLTNSQSVTTENAQTDTYPSASLFLRYFMTQKTNIFWGSGLTTRTPTSVERYTQQGASFYGNPSLNPAHNLETDLGLETELFSKLKIRIKGFYSEIDDFIYQVDVPAKTWANVDAYIWGGDFTLSLDIINNLSIDGGIAYQVGKKRDSLPGNNDKDLAEIAPAKSKLALNYHAKQFSIIGEWLHSEEHRKIDSEAGETKLKGWDVVNVRGQYRLGDASKGQSILSGLSLNVGINNIFDKKYAVANSYEYDPTDPNGTSVKIVNEPGRFFYGNISYQF